MGTRRKKDGRLLLGQEEARKRLGFGRDKWRYLLREGLGPKPVDLPGRRLWSAADLDEWVKDLGRLETR